MPVVEYGAFRLNSVSLCHLLGMQSSMCCTVLLEFSHAQPVGKVCLTGLTARLLHHLFGIEEQEAHRVGRGGIDSVISAVHN